MELDDEPPAKPVSRERPSPVAVEKRLHDTLSGLMPAKKAASGSSPPFPAAERPERPAERTGRVNVAEAMASLTARPQPTPRSGESQLRGISSVEKLLSDTLSGIMPPPKTSPPAPPARPREIAREVSGETARMKVTPIPPPVPPAPPPMERPVETRPVKVGRPASSPGVFGRYQLLEKIGAGGMAEVFKARMKGEQGFEKIVAIKRIVPHMATNAEFVTMFVDEAKLAAQLNHNNITHIYDLGKVDAWIYIAMEYVEGKDLRTLLKLGKERGFPLPAELALFIAAKIANALDYAHRRPAADGSELNLVHRDVSPQNILISDEGDIKLCDFGIAKAASKVSTTMSGALKGKLQYMSPEQAWGKRLDRRSDIFSLGSVLYEMLTGAPLFEGDTDMSVLESVRGGEVAASHVPRRRGAEARGSDRPQGAREEPAGPLPERFGVREGPACGPLHVPALARPGRPRDLHASPRRGAPGVRGRRSTPPSTLPATCPDRPRRRLPLPRLLRRKERASSSRRRTPAKSRGRRFRSPRCSLNRRPAAPWGRARPRPRCPPWASRKRAAPASSPESASRRRCSSPAGSS